MKLACSLSPCPNDTFAFHALMVGAIATPGLEFEFEFHDIEELNTRFRAGASALSKVSFAALHGLSAVEVLDAGAALGYGLGPLLLCAPGIDPKAPPPASARVLCPGEHTTATRLLRGFYPQLEQIEQRLFSQIMPALAHNAADYGVCIHEGRFTYSNYGLRLVEDLGARWEREYQAPLPLGGIAWRPQRLPGLTASKLSDCIRRSIEYARQHPQAALSSMRRYASEQDDAALWKHVELYVTQDTHTLSPQGRAAIERLLRLGSG